MNIIREIIAIKEAIKRFRIVDGANYKAESKPTGTTLHIDQAAASDEKSSGTNFYKAIIVSKTTTWVYVADIYDDPNETKIEDDAVIRVAGGTSELATGETIPSGAMLDVKPQTIDDGVNTSTYTIIGLPRSL
jgi:hypothetical protein